MKSNLLFQIKQASFRKDKLLKIDICILCFVYSYHGACFKKREDYSKPKYIREFFCMSQLKQGSAKPRQTACNSCCSLFHTLVSAVYFLAVLKRLKRVLTVSCQYVFIQSVSGQQPKPRNASVQPAAPLNRSPTYIKEGAQVSQTRM